MEWVFVVVPRGYEIQVYSEELPPRKRWYAKKTLALIKKAFYVVLAA